MNVKVQPLQPTPFFDVALITLSCEKGVLSVNAHAAEVLHLNNAHSLPVAFDVFLPREISAPELVRWIWDHSYRHASPTRFPQVFLCSETETILCLELPMKRPDGSTFTARLGITLPQSTDTFVTMAIEDVSLERLRRDQFTHTLNMQHIGRVTGIAAHDINNVLSAISGYTDLVLATLPSSDPCQSDLQEIATAIRRPSEMLRNMVLFSGRRATQPTTFDLSSLLADLLAARTDLSIESHIEPNTMVHADPFLMRIVLEHLLTNAKEASLTMKPIQVNCQAVVLTFQNAFTWVHLKPGPHIQISIIDHGDGIPEAISEEIFEPFFSTRKKGKGSGMGLTVAWYVVHAHSGQLRLRATEGGGTTAEIFLPAVISTERT